MGRAYIECVDTTNDWETEMLTFLAVLLALAIAALLISAATGHTPAIISINTGGINVLLELIAELLGNCN
jgi:hypothetical protein